MLRDGATGESGTGIVQVVISLSVLKIEVTLKCEDIWKNQNVAEFRVFSVWFTLLEFHLPVMILMRCLGTEYGHKFSTDTFIWAVCCHWHGSVAFRDVNFMWKLGSVRYLLLGDVSTCNVLYQLLELAVEINRGWTNIRWNKWTTSSGRTLSVKDSTLVSSYWPLSVADINILYISYFSTFVLCFMCYATFCCCAEPYSNALKLTEGVPCPHCSVESAFETYF